MEVAVNKRKEGTCFPGGIRPDIQERLEPAVREVFSNEDFHRASIKGIAKKAEVSFETIYKYYGSKEGLLFSFVDIWYADITERIYDHLQGLEDLKEKVRKVFWLMLDYYERNPDVGRILFLTVPWRTWTLDRTFNQERLTKIFIKVLKDGQKVGLLNPNVRAGVLLDFLYGFIRRCVAMWFYRGQKDSLTGQFNELFEIIWRAISNPNREAELKTRSSESGDGYEINQNGAGAGGNSPTARGRGANLQ